MTQEEILALTAAAQQLWAGTLDLAQLAGVSFAIADLSGSRLARTDMSGGGPLITIDADAAGAGWFVDSTPWEHSEFESAGGPAAAWLDLLTVLVHELGHLLGIGHVADPDDLMSATLPAGTRRLPRLGGYSLAATDELLVQALDAFYAELAQPTGQSH